MYSSEGGSEVEVGASSSTSLKGVGAGSGSVLVQTHDELSEEKVWMIPNDRKVFVE